MLIGLISDTHVKDRAIEIPKSVFEAFKDVDLIIHSGDITSIEVINELEKIAPVIAIQGNMDRYFGLDLPKSKIINVENKKIGVVHGEVYPKGDMQQLYYIALELGVDILIAGHSHKAVMRKYENILFINPGSPTVPVLADPTVMLMKLDKENVDISVIKVGNPVCSALNFKKMNDE